MNELKKFIAEEMAKYKIMRDEILNSEYSDPEDADNMILYDGIIEGLAISLEKIKQIEKK